MNSEKRIPWDDRYKIGNEIIDSQHKRLFEMLDISIAFSREENFEQNVRSLLQDLKSYVLIHFKDEEDYMRRIGFPMLKEHILQHQKLTKTLYELQELLLEDLSNFDRLIQFLVEWLKFHVLYEDKQISVYKRSLKS